MYQRLVLSVIFLIIFSFNQTVNADITGKVSNQSGDPIAGATVTLVSNAATATTGTDGMYVLATASIKLLPSMQVKRTGITLQKGFLNFSLQKAAQVKYEIFDIKGKLLKKEVLQNVKSGVYQFNIAGNARSATLLIIRASIGKEEAVFNYLPINNSNYWVNSSSEQLRPISGNLAKTTAAADTINVTADGYNEKAIAITSYEQVLNITMEASVTAFTISSTSFSDGEAMPDAHTCQGKAFGE